MKHNQDHFGIRVVFFLSSPVSVEIQATCGFMEPLVWSLTSGACLVIWYSRTTVSEHQTTSKLITAQCVLCWLWLHSPELSRDHSTSHDQSATRSQAWAAGVCVFVVLQTALAFIFWLSSDLCEWIKYTWHKRDTITGICLEKYVLFYLPFTWTPQEKGHFHCTNNGWTKDSLSSNVFPLLDLIIIFFLLFAFVHSFCTSSPSHAHFLSPPSSQLSSLPLSL